MKTMQQLASAFWHDEQGATAIEYGLIAALIAVVIIVSVSLVGTQLKCIFTRVADCLGGSTNKTCATACT